MSDQATSNRLTHIVTRTGDDGSTGLADGRRVPKFHPRIEAIGAVDELNSQIGLLLAEPLDANIRPELVAIQNDLFDLGGELALPERPQLTDAHVSRIDEACIRLNLDLPPLSEFILPGGARPGALAHLCRTACRTAERRVHALAEAELISARPGQYLNRLSDLFFILARQLNRLSGIRERTWRGPAAKG